MMSHRKKSKHPNHDPKPAKEQGQSTKESTNRHVYIEPGVQIDLVQDLKNQYKTANKDTTTHNEQQLLWTKIAAGLVFLYTAFSGYQACLTRNIADTAHKQLVSSERAYVSFTGFGAGMKNTSTEGKVFGEVFLSNGKIAVPALYPATNRLDALLRRQDRLQRVIESAQVQQRAAKTFVRANSDLEAELVRRGLL